MERKLSKDEFVQLFRLQRQRTKKVRRNTDRQDKTKEYNDFYRQEKHHSVWYSQICNTN